MQTKLWTKNFTITIVGSLITILGHAISSFAISLLVLDYTGSVLLYSLYMLAYYLPMVVMPLLAGPLMDNFSRAKMIYTLDFLAAFLYLGAYFLLRSGWFSYVPMLLGVLLLGSIDSIYLVAYESLYPNLISEGNYAKAYSVSSMLEPLSMAMTPVASLVYNSVGVAPLFLADFFFFFIAACFETQIKAPEDYRADKAEKKDLRYMIGEMRDGLKYIKGEPGLLVITAYFFVSMLSGTGASTLWLPWFKSAAGFGVTAYTIVQLGNVAGRFLGGFVQYRLKYPTGKKFAIALFVYTAICFIEGGILFAPLGVMLAMLFVNGLLGVTSYNIRISTTQSYVPDTYRGRFNGCFNMIMSIGNILGTLIAGALGEVLPIRGIVVGLMTLNLAAVVGIMYRGRTHVAAIYNRDV